MHVRTRTLNRPRDACPCAVLLIFNFTCPSYLSSSPPPISRFITPFPSPWFPKTNGSLDSRRPTLQVRAASIPVRPNIVHVALPAGSLLKILVFCLTPLLLIGGVKPPSYALLSHFSHSLLRLFLLILAIGPQCFAAIFDSAPTVAP